LFRWVSGTHLPHEIFEYFVNMPAAFGRRFVKW
jgi:hypothetical protein